MSKVSVFAYFILTVSVGYAFAYPYFNEINALTAKKAKYEEALEMVNSLEAKKNELTTRYNSIPEENRKRINTILPSSFSFVRLISQIDSVASGHGISISGISSKEDDNSVGETIETAGPARQYRSAIIGFSFDSSYAQSNAFLDDLEKSMRILDIRTLSIKQNDKGVYSYSVEFNTYWLPS